MIENRDNYKTRVVSYGTKLNKVRTPDGVLHIDVRDVPNCTWELEGDTFFCTHDEFEIVDCVEDFMTIDGPDQRESKGYQCADPDCKDPMEGSPEEDSVDEDWEYEKLREY